MPIEYTFTSAISGIAFSISSIVFALSILKLINFSTFHFRTSRQPLQNYKLNGSTRSGTSSGGKESEVAWALISGSSGGIGFGYAHFLLSLGFGVIILAHEGLDEAEAKLQQAFPNGHMKAITFNCMTASVSDIETLIESIQDMPITILINNVGGVPIEHPKFRHFRDYEARDIDEHWGLNARFMSHVTLLMLPLLTRNASPRSLILNITSGARTGLPLLIGYSATKGYVTSFSHTLTRECKAYNYPIDCLLIVPGDVISDGNYVGHLAGSPRAGPYAKLVLKKVDIAIERGYMEMSPYWKHALQIAVISWVPEALLRAEMLKACESKKEAYAKEYARLHKER